MARAGIELEHLVHDGHPFVRERWRRRDDDEVHRAARELSASLPGGRRRPERAQLLVDAGEHRRGPRRAVAAHGFLQRRPSRASRSSACSGPHDPAG